MLKNISLKIKLIASSIMLVLISGAAIGGLSLQQFISFSRDAVSETYAGLKKQGFAIMQTGVEANVQRIEALIRTTEDSARRLAVSSNMQEYLKVERDAQQMFQREAHRIVEGAVKTLRVQHNALQIKVDESLDVAAYVMAHYGGLTQVPDIEVRWSAENQVTGDSSSVKLPQLLVGGRPMMKMTIFEIPVMVVDEVQNMMNTNCTIFQRMNPEGNMLRVATNIAREDGQRAVGTYIPSLHPDGTPNPVVSTLLQGETYRGRAYVVKDWYITAYQPLFDTDDEVIGALYVGVPQENELLTDTILGTNIGETGHAFVIDSHGEVLVHPRSDLVGQNIVSDVGLALFQDVLEQREEDVVKTLEYETDGQKQFVSYTFFPEWDWIICVHYSGDDVAKKAIQRAQNALENEMLTMYATSTVTIGQQERHIFPQIRYINEHGREMLVLKDGEWLPEGGSKADASWFAKGAELSSDNVYNSGVDIAANTGNVAMRVLAPVFDGESFKGMMVVNLAWEFAWELLKDRVYGETGYAYIVDDQGIVISHPKFRLPDRVDTTDPVNGDALATLAHEQMLTGKTGTSRYTFEGIDKFVAFAPLSVGEKTYSLAATMPADEFFAIADDIKARTDRRFTRTIGIVAGVIVLSIFFAVGIGIVISRSITQPVNRVIEFAQNVSQGDLSATLPVMRQDEIGTFLSIINQIVQSLRKFITTIQHSSMQVTSSANELAATAQQQKVIVATQVESTGEVGNSINDISLLTTQLLHLMQDLASMTQETARFATAGQTDLTRMEDSMRHMESASKSISAKLETINEKAGNITNVVTTINKVAGQTNLLSLNASIEAEKAGEYGRGFTVVAREIRRLADQTDVATLDIDQMVQEMQTAVAAGVMEMDKFIAAVRHSVADVAKISGQLARIIEQVQVLSPRFEDVNHAMQQQSDHAQTINTTMNRLNEEMQETSESLQESFLSIEQLNEAVHILKEEVSRFAIR